MTDSYDRLDQQAEDYLDAMHQRGMDDARFQLRTGDDGHDAPADAKGAESYQAGWDCIMQEEAPRTVCTITLSARVASEAHQIIRGAVSGEEPADTFEKLVALRDFLTGTLDGAAAA